MTPTEEKAQAYAENQIDGMEFANEYERQCAVNNYKCAYLQGSNDILSLPLCERLTEEEKEKIRAKYAHGQKMQSSKSAPASCSGSCMCATLEQIFGSDFFKEGE